MKIYAITCPPSSKLVQLVRLITHETTTHASARLILYLSTAAQVDYLYRILPLLLPPSHTLFSLHGHIPPTARMAALRRVEGSVLEEDSGSVTSLEIPKINTNERVRRRSELARIRPHPSTAAGEAEAIELPVIAEYGGDGGGIMFDAADGRRAGCEALGMVGPEVGFLACGEVSDTTSCISFPSPLVSASACREGSPGRRSPHRPKRSSPFY